MSPSCDLPCLVGVLFLFLDWSNLYIGALVFCLVFFYVSLYTLYNIWIFKISYIMSLPLTSKLKIYTTRVFQIDSSTVWFFPDFFRSLLGLSTHLLLLRSFLIIGVCGTPSSYTLHTLFVVISGHRSSLFRSPVRSLLL